MKRKAQPIVDPTAKCVRCGVSIGKPRRSHRLSDGTRPWVRFCPECRILNMREAKTSETQRIITAKLVAMNKAKPPEERSEINRRGQASMSPEAKAKRNRLCSEAAKRQKNRPPRTAEAIARWSHAGLISRQAKAAAKIAKGVFECPHCKCTFPLDCFSNNKGSREWSGCKLCYSIRRTYGRFPFILKRTGLLNLPLDFHGFKKRSSRAVYEQYWLPKLDTGRRIYEGPSLGWQDIEGASPAPGEGAQPGTGSNEKV